MVVGPILYVVWNEENADLELTSSKSLSILCVF